MLPAGAAAPQAAATVPQAAATVPQAAVMVLLAGVTTPLAAATVPWPGAPVPRAAARMSLAGSANVTVPHGVATAPWRVRLAETVRLAEPGTIDAGLAAARVRARADRARADGADRVDLAGGRPRTGPAPGAGTRARQRPRRAKGHDEAPGRPLPAAPAGRSGHPWVISHAAALGRVTTLGRVTVSDLVPPGTRRPARPPREGGPISLGGMRRMTSHVAATGARPGRAARAPTRPAGPGTTRVCGPTGRGSGPARGGHRVPAPGRLAMP
jgi:hypothetical protein